MPRNEAKLQSAGDSPIKPGRGVRSNERKAEGSTTLQLFTQYRWAIVELQEKALAQSSSFMLRGRQFIWHILAMSPSHHWMHLALLVYPIVQGSLKIGFIRNDKLAPGAGTWAGILCVFFEFAHQDAKPIPQLLQ